ncbi:cytochrome b-c1 complex subunit 6, mitochondrial [Condylostylus longicornis]|uniref:cytochrome b-c1 complex subunit 6, mitochondrial n=1 Tax=Condylostylus longicornis TaxID=2530218 RepID=UPI00244E2AC7|nr:cytochrome b-c1 complex subunit 6, mitochondrial [Condylostylus longicornis]
MAPTKESMFSFLPDLFKTFSSFIPIYSVKTQEAEEEELVDPQTALREKCNAEGKIEALYAKYQECNDRVNSRSKTTETCVEELFDYIHELDHCVAHHNLFSKIK